MKKTTLTLCILFCFAVANFAQTSDKVFTKADSDIYEKYVQEFKDQKDKPLAEIITNTAKYFIGTPYVASTLEGSKNEVLTINLRQFDCTTFVESCIALSQTIKSGDTSFSNYCNFLTSIRYRNNEVEDYISRLHYVIDWIFENENDGVFTNITSQIGGRREDKRINYMSTHPGSYKQLRNNNIVNMERIRIVEKNINDRNNLYLLPKSQIERNQSKIQNGDIIAFVTSIKGLDYSHMGIAYWQNDQLHFIHASSAAKKVVIENKTLSAYCQDSKSCTGITVLRVK